MWLQGPILFLIRPANQKIALHCINSRLENRFLTVVWLSLPLLLTNPLYKAKFTRLQWLFFNLFGFTTPFRTKNKWCHTYLAKKIVKLQPILIVVKQALILTLRVKMPILPLNMQVIMEMQLLKNSIMILTLKIQVLVIIEKNDKKVKIHLKMMLSLKMQMKMEKIFIHMIKL